MSELDEKLLEINKQIEKVREILNEVCVTSEDSEATLIISQCLDELIVEYFKVVTKQNNNLLSN